MAPPRRMARHCSLQGRANRARDGGSQHQARVGQAGGDKAGGAGRAAMQIVASRAGAVTATMRRAVAGGGRPDGGRPVRCGN